MKHTLLEYINDKTNNKYNYLKLKEVVYHQKANKCVVFFIYPHKHNEPTQETLNELTNVVSKYLQIEAKVEVFLNKSYLEEDLLKKYIINYFENSHKSIAGSVKNGVFDIDIDDLEVKIKMSFIQETVDYIEQSRIKDLLLEEFNKNFCGYFNINFSTIADSNNENYYDSLLKDRLKKLQRESELNELLSPKRKRYPVANKRLLLGEEITVDPQTIKDTTKVGAGVILAGRVKFLTQKTYKSKRTEKNENGEEVQVEKPYFRFVLEDKTGNIGAVIFPSKANYHKMNLLDNGQTIIVKGDISEFNNKMELSVKSISYCEIPTVEEIMIKNNVDIHDRPYTATRPIPFTSLHQTNLFDVETVTPEFFMGKTFVIYDLETTGLDPVNSEIIEIGAIKLVDGKTTEAFSTFVKPKSRIPDVITKITNITDEMVADAHPIETVIMDFYKFTKGAILAGYNNLDFDSKFIQTAGRKAGVEFLNEEQDVLVLARAKRPGLKSYKLIKVAEHLGVELTNAHRALNDVIATTEVFLKLYENNTWNFK